MTTENLKLSKTYFKQINKKEKKKRARKLLANKNEIETICEKTEKHY
jgi:hypothetical protein